MHPVSVVPASRVSRNKTPPSKPRASRVTSGANPGPQGIERQLFPDPAASTTTLPVSTTRPPGLHHTPSVLTVTLTDTDLRSALSRMAADAVALTPDLTNLAIMGIHRRGTDLAEMLAEHMAEIRPGLNPALGSIDITLYRDDLRSVGPKPVIGGSELPPGGIDDKTVLLVDDVLFTGRTVRAALNELSDWGRPARIILCVLIDRGGRELPIQADIVGARLELPPEGRVDVLVPEVDGSFCVAVRR